MTTTNHETAGAMDRFTADDIAAVQDTRDDSRTHLRALTCIYEEPEEWDYITKQAPDVWDELVEEFPDIETDER